jgi:hypothetical protein
VCVYVGGWVGGCVYIYIHHVRCLKQGTFYAALPLGKSARDLEKANEAKETYYRGKRDLLQRQKRPTTKAK